MTILPNLKRALWVRPIWRCSSGRVVHSDKLPAQPTMNGEPFDPEERVYIGEVQISRLEQAKRLGGPDKWTFRVTITFPHKDTVEIDGESAEHLWDVWKGIVFKKVKNAN